MANEESAGGKLDIAVDNNNNKVPEKKEWFRLGAIPIDPMFVYMALIYAVTRPIEMIFQTEGFWEAVWGKFVDFFDVDDHDFLVFVITGFLMTLYWGLSFIFLILDLTGACKKYKIQPGKNEPVELSKVWPMIFTILFNQLVISLTISSAGYWLAKAMNGERDMKQVPTIWILMRDLIASYLIFDVVFYTTHRMMHSKRFYKRIHKMHHEWKAPIGIASIYAHPTEHLIVNMGSAVFGPIALKSEVCTLYIFLASIIFTTITDHSGYHFPFFKSSEFHDHHHVFFTENFGSNGVMDFIFRTDTKFRQSIHFKRHQVYWSFKSIRELYPKKDTRPIETKKVE